MTIKTSKYSIIQERALNNKDKLITTNGIYIAEAPYSGFNKVEVAIPEPQYSPLNINPSISTQTFTVQDIYHGYSPITVNPVTSSIDNNIKPENIKKGITILGVTGNIEFITEELTVTPTRRKQTKTPSSDGYSKVVINAVTSDIDGNILPENIVSGIEILGVAGTATVSKETTRNIERNGVYEPPAGYTGFSSVEVNVELDLERLVVNPTTSRQTFTSQDEYHGYTPVIVNAVTSDIDSNIQEGNIKQGITILGVSGTCVELNAQQLEVSLTSEDVIVTASNGSSIQSEWQMSRPQFVLSVHCFPDDAITNTSHIHRNDGCSHSRIQLSDHHRIFDIFHNSIHLQAGVCFWMWQTNQIVRY